MFSATEAPVSTYGGRWPTPATDTSRCCAAGPTSWARWRSSRGADPLRALRDERAGGLGLCYVGRRRRDDGRERLFHRVRWSEAAWQAWRRADLVAIFLADRRHRCRHGRPDPAPGEPARPARSPSAAPPSSAGRSRGASAPRAGPRRPASWSSGWAPAPFFGAIAAGGGRGLRGLRRRAGASPTPSARSSSRAAAPARPAGLRLPRALPRPAPCWAPACTSRALWPSRCLGEPRHDVEVHERRGAVARADRGSDPLTSRVRQATGAGTPSAQATADLIGETWLTIEQVAVVGVQQAASGRPGARRARRARARRRGQRLAAAEARRVVGLEGAPLLGAAACGGAGRRARRSRPR